MTNWKKIEKGDTFRIKIAKIVVKIINLLTEKNEQYGDSAFDPMRFFSDLGPDAGLRVRIDDKLSRLMRGNDSIETDVDVIEDLIGYFILLRLTMEKDEEDILSDDFYNNPQKKNKFWIKHGGEEE